MIVAVTGASGFVGQHLMPRLREQGHEVREISVRRELPAGTLEGCHAVIHLAGEPIAQRWTASAKKRILESRIDGTRRLVNAMRDHPPQVLVSASAIGYYGSRGDQILKETSPPADDFLANVVKAWEREAEAAERLGVRVVRLRFGLILGPGGGALQKMLLPFKLGIGGPIAGGEHWMSWIHIDDLTSLAAMMLKESTVRGAFNATSPFPVQNAEFTRALAQALHRPAFMPVPAFAIRLLFGEMSEAVLASQRVLPEATLRTGFTFEYPDVFAALTQILD